MRVDLFLMNPPFGNQQNTRLCTNIMKKLENKRVVCISAYGGVSNVLNKITSIESAGWRDKVFPDADTWSYIWTMNDRDPLYKEIHKLKSIKNSKYFFLKKGYDQKIYYITKENKSEDNRVYIDIKNDEEMNDINKYIRDNFEKYMGFLPALNTHTWIIANILYNSKWRERFVK